MQGKAQFLKILYQYRTLIARINVLRCQNAKREKKSERKEKGKEQRESSRNGF